MIHYNKHYIRVDSQNRVLFGFSDAFQAAQSGDVCINEAGGYHFRLFAHGEENLLLVNPDGTHKYIFLTGENPVCREATPEELSAELAEITEGLPAPEPSTEDTVRLLRAQLQASTERQNFLEDCIAEMAAQVYSV